ncbi:MAG: FAD-binding domain-containing protein, partial [Thermoleophilia bacterium]|nr:FAD-binding domain-containing protein [Thermoleophilia bacterium]
FTPFWRAASGGLRPPDPLPAPKAPAPPAAVPAGLSPADLERDALKPWAAGFGDEWQPGEAGARARLARLLDDVLPAYADDRDRPDLEGSSRLSPHLHWGELSPRQVWHAVAGRLAEAGLEAEAAIGPPSWKEAGPSPGLARGAAAFLRQLGWREFAHHLLWHFPDTVAQPLRPAFSAFPWRDEPAGLAAWQRGVTGYPFVDAAMRSLWTTGWMHNRARLVAGSFLVKDLLLPWRAGAAWFWDTLVDADLANNTLGWQWVSGCGADAAPYFRIFNPVTQGGRFDPDGAFVRRWVPELSELPAEWVHEPWEAPGDVLAAAGVRLGETYPAPIVDHGEARSRALAAYEVVKLAR